MSSTVSKLHVDGLCTYDDASTLTGAGHADESSRVHLMSCCSLDRAFMGKVLDHCGARNATVAAKNAGGQGAMPVVHLVTPWHVHDWVELHNQVVASSCGKFR